MKRPRAKIVLALSAAVMLLFSACGTSTTPPPASGGQTGSTQAESGGKATSKSTLTVASYSDPQSLNPYARDTLNAKRIYMNVYQHLLDRSEEKSGEFTGTLAESWEIADDGLSATFHLRKGVKFQNGEEMKASDVVFSFHEMANFPTVISGLDFIKFKDVKATDDYTVVIPLASPSSTLLWILSDSNIVIVNEKAYKEMGDSVATRMCGTGPFKVNDGDYMLNDHLTLTRNDDYWGEKPALEKVTIRFIPEGTQAIMELEAGGIDASLDVPMLDYQRIKESDKLKLEEFPMTLVDMISFNNSLKPFDDVRVRQAMAYAISREDIQKSVYMGLGTIPYSAIPPNIFGYTNEFEGDKWPYKVDYEKSKALLKEAGYPDGFSFVLLVDEDVNRQKTSEIIKNQLANIGVTANLQIVQQTVVNDMIAQNKAQSWLLAVNASTMEADKALYIRYHISGAYNGGSNFVRFSNKEFSDLLDQARLSTDDDEKLQYYKKAQEIWVDQVPSVPYWNRLNVVASVKGLKGLKSYGEGYLFKDCYFE